MAMNMSNSLQNLRLDSPEMSMQVKLDRIIHRYVEQSCTSHLRPSMELHSVDLIVFDNSVTFLSSLSFKWSWNMAFVSACRKCFTFSHSLFQKNTRIMVRINSIELMRKNCWKLTEGACYDIGRFLVREGGEVVHLFFHTIITKNSTKAPTLHYSIPKHIFILNLVDDVNWWGIPTNDQLIGKDFVPYLKCTWPIFYMILIMELYFFKNVPFYLWDVCGILRSYQRSSNYKCRGIFSMSLILELEDKWYHKLLFFHYVLPT